MIQLLSSMNVQTMVFAILIAIIVVLFIAILLVSARLAKYKKLLKQQNIVAASLQGEPVAEKAEEPAAEVEPVEEKAKEPAVEEKAEEPAIEVVGEEAEPTEEKTEEPVVVNESATEETTVAAKPKKERKAKDKTEKPFEEKDGPVEVKEEGIEPVAEVTEEAETAADVADGTDEKKVVGKMEICNSDLGGYTFILRANNGQLLYEESKSYGKIKDCEKAAQAFIEATKAGKFTIRKDKFDRYKFILKSATSNLVIYIGESFDNERASLSNFESVCRFASNCVFVDNTSKDFKAPFTTYTIPDDVKDKVENNNGIVGKWAIERTEEDNKNAPFVFLLYASNGQLLYESRDYGKFNTCKDGLETFRKTVKDGHFVIDPDKAGRYKFILRSNDKKSQMVYVGQNYSTERACAEGINSIYRFALVSPTDKIATSADKEQNPSK